MQKAGNFVFVVASAFALADILVEQGHLREAEKTYQQSLQLAAEHGKEAQQVTAHHYLGLAMLYHEMGEAAAAAEHLQRLGIRDRPRWSTGLTAGNWRRSAPAGGRLATGMARRAALSVTHGIPQGREVADKCNPYNVEVM
jgi:hypothetical protein